MLVSSDLVNNFKIYKEDETCWEPCLNIDFSLKS